MGMNSDRAPYPAGTFCGYGRGLFQFKVIALACWLVCAGAGRVSAAIQFDVFLGYDGLIPEACWFPIVCEVKNDGPSFTGTVEVKGGYNQDQSLLTTIELPTSTLKRFVLPVFSNGRGYATWDVRLLDERGKVRSE